jgi:hypothetical protein
MEVYNTKGVIIMYPLAVFAIMLILLNGYSCAATAVLVKTNTTFRCDGHLDECLIEDDLELEFLMNPYVSRVLGNQPGSPTQNSLDGNIPACGERNHRYGNCISQPSESPNPKGCNPKYVYSKCASHRPGH